MNKILAAIFIIAFTSCNNRDNNSPVNNPDTTNKEIVKTSFGDDLRFLQQYHKDLVILGNDSNGARIIIAPAYQGRVMTSTAEGNNGLSFGWINRELISSGKPAEHINAFGGEERFWLGPEGGQFSIYFKKGVEFKFENWFVPKEIDSEPFDVLGANTTMALFNKKIHLENYSGNNFEVDVRRMIRLLNRSAIDSALGIAISPSLHVVGFESENSIMNNGKTAWTKQTGMLSIWILSMMNASGQTTVAVPYKKGDSTTLGKIVTDDYFGKVPGDRLKDQDGLLLFKADANHRSKIGISPKRALPFIGSYDAVNNVLTIAQFDLHPETSDYVNSLWKIQDDPFAGDAVNSYNDGRIDGKQMGKFYEIESSSPAAALAPGKTMSHVHRTIHLKGSKEELDKIAKKLFGVGVNQITL